MNKGGERIEVKNGSLTFVYKVENINRTEGRRGRKKMVATLYCLTACQAFRLSPTKSYWFKKYNNLASLAMLGTGDVGTLTKLAEWCYDDNGNKVINWEYINRRYV